jgi:hypothetical protein
MQEGLAGLRNHFMPVAGVTLSYQRMMRNSIMRTRDFQDSIVSLTGEYRY